MSPPPETGPGPLELTSLEAAILRTFAAELWPELKVDQFLVTSRKHTGVGRYSDLVDLRDQHVSGRGWMHCSMHLEMEDLDGGLLFVVNVHNSRISCIELCSQGGEPWDGTERSWTLER